MQNRASGQRLPGRLAPGCSCHRPTGGRSGVHDVDHDHESSFSTDLLFDRNVDGSRYYLERRSDGTVIVLDTQYAGHGSTAGLEVPLGSKALSIDVHGAAVDVQGDGFMYVLRTPKELAAYQQLQTWPALDQYVHGPHVLTAEQEMMLKQMHYELAEDTYSMLGREAEVTVGGSVAGVSGGLEVAGGVRKVVKTNHRTGETTVEWEVDGASTGQLGAVLLGSAQATAGRSLAVAMTFASDGTPKRLEVTTSAALDRSSSLLNGDFGGIGKLADLPEAMSTDAGVTNQGGGSNMVRVVADLDLSDPATRHAALAFAHQPSPGSGADLLNRFENSGNVLVEAYQGSNQIDDAHLGASLGATLGFTSKDKVTRLTLAHAWSWDPVSGGRVRDDCLA